MNRLVIASACALGACAAPVANTGSVERELGALAASVRRLESRLAAESLWRSRVSVAAGRRSLSPEPRHDQAQPGTGPQPQTRATPPPAPAGEVSTPKRQGPARPTAAPGKNRPAARAPRRSGPDPIRELAVEVARLRTLMRANSPTTPSPVAGRDPVAASPASPVRSVPSRPEITPGPNPERGRYQVAGIGQSAWQTVLDTRTGVVYNYRLRDGKNCWVPITLPVTRSSR